VCRFVEIGVNNLAFAASFVYFFLCVRILKRWSGSKKLRIDSHIYAIDMVTCMNFVSKDLDFVFKVIAVDPI
jgi:hypothetical protein